MALAIHGRKLRRMVIAAALAVAAQIQGGDCLAHDTMTEDVSFGCKVANVAGTFTYLGHPFYQPGPQVVENQTCVVIVGGTLSDTRDGGMDRKGAPPRDALKRLAKQLASAGYASLRYDRVGHGGSQPTKAWTGDEAEVAASAIEFA